MDGIYIKNSFVCFLEYFKKKLENITKEERSKLNTNIEAFTIPHLLYYLHLHSHFHSHFHSHLQYSSQYFSIITIFFNNYNTLQPLLSACMANGNIVIEKKFKNCSLKNIIINNKN